MLFEWHNREKHCALLKTRLEALRGLFFTGTNSAEYLELFDEFLEQREFGLATDRLCDFLLEADVRPVGKAELKQVEELYALMDAEDDRILKLKKKCTELETDGPG